MIGLAIIWLGLVAIYWTPMALANTQDCTREEAHAAEAIAATAQSWGQLHQQFERYAHCDDGAVAEGFSESVTNLLADRWGGVQQLEAVLGSDPGFRKFVIRHIDETVPVERLKRIARNAGKQCPKNLKSLCRDIRAAALKQ